MSLKRHELQRYRGRWKRLQLPTSETHVEEEEELSLTPATPQTMKSGVKHSALSREKKAVADERCESMEAVPETATGRTEQTSTAGTTEWNSAMNKQQQYILTQLSATTHNSSKEPGLKGSCCQSIQKTWLLLGVTLEGPPDFLESLLTGERWNVPFLYLLKTTTAIY